METINVNFWAIAVGVILSMVIGAIWYGPLFGKKWMEIVGVNPDDLEARKEMQQSAGPLYVVQFIMTLLLVFILGYLAALTDRLGALPMALLVWAGFVIPTLAGAVMWSNEDKRQKWARFLIQGGYQLLIYIVFGLLLQFWK